MRIVLDTNVLLVSLPSHSPFNVIYQAMLQGHITLFVTNEILTEYEEQISTRLGIDRTEIQLRELLNLPNFQRIDVYYNWRMIDVDPDDNKFVDCAFACGADYLVSNDRNFNALSQYDFPKVNVIRAEEFLRVLSAGKEDELL